MESPRVVERESTAEFLNRVITSNPNAGKLGSDNDWSQQVLQSGNFSVWPGVNGVGEPNK